MHHVGLDRADRYTYDVLADNPELAHDKGSDLRALIRSLNQPSKPTDVLRNGPVPAADVAGFADVYERGRQEILAWMRRLRDVSSYPSATARMSLYVDTHCHLDLFQDPRQALDRRPGNGGRAGDRTAQPVPAARRQIPRRPAGACRSRPASS